MGFLMDMKIELKRSLKFQGDIEQVRRSMDDLPALLKQFPKLDQLKELKPNAYEWTLHPIGAAGISHVVVYAADYSTDLSATRVSWVPVKGVGNASLHGSLECVPHGDDIELRVEISGQLRDMSIPLTLRLLAPAYIKKTFEILVDKFSVRLSEHFSR